MYAVVSGRGGNSRIRPRSSRKDEDSEKSARQAGTDIRYLAVLHAVCVIELCPCAYFLPSLLCHCAALNLPHSIYHADSIVELRRQRRQYSHSNAQTNGPVLSRLSSVQEAVIKKAFDENLDNVMAEQEAKVEAKRLAVEAASRELQAAYAEAGDKLKPPS